MRPIFIIFCLIWYLYQQEESVSAGTLYFSHERPAVNFFDKKYFKSFELKSFRNGRNDPRYYVTIFTEVLKPLGNQVTCHFYFYQLLTNRYRPSFVEMHLKFCDMIDKDPLFGSQLKRHTSMLNVSCPYPPKVYNLTGMAIPTVPKNFPFEHGRIFLNMTLNPNILILNIQIDMDIKQMYTKSRRN